jgi:hypothetical protein
MLSPLMRDLASRRPTAAAALLYAALALLMVGQGLLPGRTLSASDYLWTAAPWSATTPGGVRLFGANGELADSVAAFQPFTQHTRATLPHIPLWDDAISGGRPFLANMQSGVFSPFNVPSYVLPFWWSLALVAALKLFVAALGTFALGRALGMRFAGALLAGLAFGFSLYMVTWLAWPLTAVWALLPWLLVAVDRVLRRPDATGVALLALATGLGLLSGHPESSFHVLVFAALFAVLRLSRLPRSSWPRGGLALTAGLAAGAGLAAVVLLPFLELVHHSGDLAERANRDPAHLRRTYGLSLAMPEYWGRPTQVMLEPFINARAFYAGALPLLLAGLAVVLRPSRERVAIAAAALVSLGVALGVPGLFEAVHALPGFSTAVNTRLGVFVCLGVALLAGFGLDDLLARAAPVRPRLERFVPVALAAAVALPALVVLVHAPVQFDQLGSAAGIALGVKDATGEPDLAGLLPLSAALAWLALAGAGAALVLRARRGALRAPAVAVLAVALVAIDLTRFGMGQNPAIPLDHARQPATPAIQYLRDQRPARFAGMVPDFGITPLPADTALRYGLQDARGYDYPVVKRYDRLWRRSVAPKLPFIPPTTLASATPQSLRVLGLLGVRSLVQQPGDRPLRSRYAQPVLRGRDATIYRNRFALPRAFLVERQRVVADEDAALAAVAAFGTDLAHMAVVERPVAGMDGPRSLSAAPPVRVTRQEPERVELVTTPRRRCILVLSDVWYPGWHAKVDGRDVPVERVDYLLRGVALDPGRHTVEMRYRPLSFRLGWIISLLTALGLAAAVVVSRRRGGAA